MDLLSNKKKGIIDTCNNIEESQNKITLKEIN